MNKRVSVIILNYKNYLDTIDCINSVLATNYDDLKIIVIDNASNNESVISINKIFSNKIDLIVSNVNLGYAGGNNLGIKRAIDLNSQYICILNNDTIVKSNFIDECIKVLDSNKEIGIVSPFVMEYKKNIIQSTGGKIDIKHGGADLINNGANINDISNDVDCDFISGACMFFRREIIEINGLLPESYFLFFEETEWCYRLKNKGYLVKSIKNTTIEHKGSAAINEISGLSRYLLRRNRVVFMKRNAKKHDYWCFLFYILLETIYYKIIKKRDCTGYSKAYWDGMNNKIDIKRFPFIIIND